MSPLKLSAVPVIIAVGTIDSSEHGLQTVIIGLGNWIKFVVVTSCAMNRAADKSRHHGGDHVVAVKVTNDFFVGGLFENILLRTFVPRTGGDHAGGDDAVGVLGKKDITGDLFLDESGLRFVL